MTYRQRDDLAIDEIPRCVMDPLLRSMRFANTACDALFHDVNAFTAALEEQSREGKENAASPALRYAAREALDHFSFEAVSDPEGSVLIIDANAEPYVVRYANVGDFLAAVNAKHSHEKAARVRTATVTGVGSSALGAAAFAWNVSQALQQPVAAIVPGYGLADALPQALGGRFGFEFHDALRNATQNVLAALAPGSARVGRPLVASCLDNATQPATGAPVSHTRSADSDALHAMLTYARNIDRVVGHSTGALGIQKAIRSLPRARQKSLSVTTFGCAVAEEQKSSHFPQSLGVVDVLGLVNSWLHRPERRLLRNHSTNTRIPPSMPVAALMRSALHARRRAAPI